MFVIFQKSPQIILIIASALIAHQAGVLTWYLYPSENTHYTWKPSFNKLTTSTSALNTTELQKLSLFGQYKGVSALPVETITEAPKTRLRISLVGIITASDPTLSSVIIEYRGKQDSYFIGSKVTGTNAEVFKIYNDRIVILVDGEQQTLILDGLEEDNKEIADIESNQKQSSRTKSRTSRKSKKIDLNRAELVANPGKLLDFIRISPVREGGKVKGYRVKPGKYPSLFESSGLQSGDLAVELNGVDLTDMSKAIGLMKEFPTMKDISLTVDRNGELNELFFSIP